MKINYVVSRYVLKNGKPVYLNGRKKTESIKGQIDLNVDWEEGEVIRNETANKHPGYSLYGYCKAPKEVKGNEV